MTDVEAIKQVLSGNVEAFSTLVVAYQSNALSLARKYLRSQERAQDAVQDAFVKAYTNLASFRQSSQFSTWFYRIVVNTCLNMLDQSQRKPVFVELDEETAPVWVDPRFVTALERIDLLDLLQEEIEQMDARYSVILELFYGRDKSYQEIAQITGAPLGTVKTRLNRGRTLLREALMARSPELELLP